MSGVNDTNWGDNDLELDLNYTDPRLVQLYDLENVWGPDDDFGLELADELGARVIVDLRCRYRLLTRALAVGGRRVIGVDPSPAMLAVARNGPNASKVQWIQGDASTLEAIGADLALMTGNMAQVFLDDEAWESTCGPSILPFGRGGRLAFTAAIPVPGSGRGGLREHTPAAGDAHRAGRDLWIEVVAAERGRVRLEGHNRFLDTGELIVAPSSLRFGSAAEIARSLEETGFVVEQMSGDWRPGPSGRTGPVNCDDCTARATESSRTKGQLVY